MRYFILYSRLLYKSLLQYGIVCVIWFSPPPHAVFYVVLRCSLNTGLYRHTRCVFVISFCFQDLRLQEWLFSVFRSYLYIINKINSKNWVHYFIAIPLVCTWQARILSVPELFMLYKTEYKNRVRLKFVRTSVVRTKMFVGAILGTDINGLQPLTHNVAIVTYFKLLF